MSDHAVVLLKQRLETLAPNDKKQQIALINNAIVERMARRLSDGQFQER
jgi:hypothetical protein